MEQLQVYLNDRLVGRLNRDRGRLSFGYDRNWLDDPAAHPLSLSLPLREAPFDDAEARSWFGNLLPEGDFLNLIARRLGRSTGDVFGLLVDLGGECAGAVSLLEPGRIPEKGDYRRLDEDALYRLVTDDPPPAWLGEDRGVRLSLAGAQNKVPVYVDDSGIHLATGRQATSHILKPRIRAVIDLPHTVENEVFCMQLAGRLGLAVPAAQIGEVRDQTFYLVERFDRCRGQDRIERLHQEDFCQALGVEANLKYEENGGPSTAAIWRLLQRHSSAPAADGRQMLRWIGFNFLIGNADAHGKNIALLYRGDGRIRLAPFYDLLCTAVYPPLDRRLALRLGGERRPERLRRRHWERLARDLKIAPRAIFAELEQLTRAIEKTAEALAWQFTDRYACEETMNGILEIIRQRSSWAWAVLGGWPD
ncbi:protein HipA [Geothermobacter hydrogeniphilus]|uniref:Protein HipA n=1 Tax=Geothermobacter hydrogeniphilus TaxID=1969733 RepID=A0A2K2H5X7_9BACT|nr:type II toxin-antitoxin system HipA family toxin [Geothermobacter hydrogeniphilus]PNU18722.1 protein HipA [Geothermobacter hydrogeniphilus]